MAKYNALLNISCREKVSYVPDITHTEWLELRKTGIGGSDAPTIARLNKHNSLYSLYCDKVGILPPLEDNEQMRQGRDLEDYVARRWCEATGKRVRRNRYMWRSTVYPFMLADVDREIVGENAGLECKTTSVYNKADLDAGEIPLNYYVQCLHYMHVMGYEKMYLAILVLSRGFYCFEIERDEQEIEALIEQERLFWECVESRTPPEVDGSDATSRALDCRYPPHREMDVSAELTDRSLAMLHTIEDLDKEIKALTEAKRAAQAVVQSEMGDCTYGDIGSYYVSWKSSSRTTIDSRRLKKEQPDIYEKYSKTSESRTFRVKKKEDSTDE